MENLGFKISNPLGRSSFSPGPDWLSNLTMKRTWSTWKVSAGPEFLLLLTCLLLSHGWSQPHPNLTEKAGSCGISGPAGLWLPADITAGRALLSSALLQGHGWVVPLFPLPFSLLTEGNHEKWELFLWLTKSDLIIKSAIFREIEASAPLPAPAGVYISHQRDFHAV